MNPNVFDLLILAGAIQGFISSCILFYRKENASNTYLAWIILLIALACFNLYLVNTLNINSRVLLVLAYCVPLIVIMPIGPLIYQFTISNFQSKRLIPKWHYQSVWIDVFPNVLAVLFFLGASLSLINSDLFSTLDKFTDNYNKYVDIVRWLSMTLYTLLAYKYLKKQEKQTSNWTKYFIFGFLIFELIWLLFLIPYILPSISNLLLGTFNWYPLYVPLVIITYWVGFTAIMQLKSQSKKVLVDSATAQKTIDYLKKLMDEQKLYRDPLLRLDKIVQLTQIPQKTISATLNQVEKKSFTEFVNEYRIEEVKQKLVDSAFGHLTITGIALDCGFNSQATFQRTFKNLVGKSPKDFRSEIRYKNTSQN